MRAALGEVPLADPLERDGCLTRFAGLLDGVRREIEQHFTGRRFVRRMQRLELTLRLPDTHARRDARPRDPRRVELIRSVRPRPRRHRLDSRPLLLGDVR
jgi:hypothetical protein